MKTHSLTLFKMLILLTFLFVAVGAHAVEPDRVTEAQWKKQMKENLVPALCEGKTFFNTCYSYGNSSCQAKVQSYMSTCQTGQRLPSSIDVLGNGVKLGKNLGSCIGKKIAKENEFRHTAQCKDRNQWLN